MIDAVNTLQSAELVARLAKPSASYKNSARLAVAGLLGFVFAYFALAGWFLYTAYRLTLGAGDGGHDAFWRYCVALCALFLGVFMLKAIFSVRNAKPEGLHEITEAEQPRLFAFLYQLADAAGAPRPHKVFLSSRVNAAVFYDLSLFNLIFPSKKNLEIGLALVNALTLGELRAVLAHEFGHFAQRSMAVGRWVYVAQQIAAHLVSRRDKLEDFLVTVGNLDLRLRLGVAVIELIVWSIRSLVESAFQVVVLMQRALSREMEMQADLVAVSLTGSDALVHALHRLQGADDAWDRALRFVFGEKGSGKATRDVFAVQTHMAQRMSAILNDANYASVPPLPAQNADRHRVFKAEMAQPPKMWLTHPLNHEREANAKRLYVAARIDPEHAWAIFDHPLQLRELMTARLLGESEAQPVALEDSLKALARQFTREQYHRRYCGAYFGRALARHVEHPAKLRDPARPSSLDELAQLYPASLADDVAQLRILDSEAQQLDAIAAGRMSASGGVVRVRGAELKKKELPAAVARIKAEAAEVTERLRAHDLLCRSWHQSVAAAAGGGWQAYLDGLLALIHYAEHTEANLLDAHGLMHNAAQVVTAIRRITADGVSRVVFQANELHHVMDEVYRLADKVVLDERIVARLEIEGNWATLLGEFKLPMAGSETINSWLGAVESWVSHLGNCLTMVRSAALEELLTAETMIAQCARRQVAPEPAPVPSVVPSAYPILLAGAERPRQTSLGWWARFQRADGILPGAARLLVAGAIVAGVLGVGSGGAGPAYLGMTEAPGVTVYNGLGTDVTVRVGAAGITVRAFGSGAIADVPRGPLHVQARSAGGALIEEFDTAFEPGSGHTVYNVAGAAPLVEWTAAYGSRTAPPQRNLGAARWFESGADVLFGPAPERISGRGNGGLRTVLDGAAKAPPQAQLGMLGEVERQRVIGLHVRWDEPQQANAMDWIAQAGADPAHRAVLDERVARTPDNVYLLRAQYDLASPAERTALCTRARERAAAAPDDGDRKYIALRCEPDGPATEHAFREALARWPGNPWLANAVAYAKLASKDWASALPELEAVSKSLPFLAEGANVSIARIKRFHNMNADLKPLLPASARLQSLVTLDQGAGPSDSPDRAYAQLANGNIAVALAYAMGDPWREAHVLRLVAASDGASADSAKRAMALPADQGLDHVTALLGLALAMRSGQDTKPYLEATAKFYGPYQPKVLAFLAQAKARANPIELEAVLDTLPLEVRGQACSAAVVLLGRRAPQAWRDASRRLLFASERPYFT